MATAKKTAAKKTTAASKTKDKPDEQVQIPEGPDRLSVEELASQVIAGKWGTGRERDVKLIIENYDPLAVNKEVAKQLSER